MSVVVLIVPFILKNMFNSLHFLKHKFRIVLVTHILGKVYNLGRAEPIVLSNLSVIYEALQNDIVSEKER